ncbi:hypothetical protein [Nocardioides sp. YIM 152588]|uniref:hypothetical protein n=1 Tax=Nocardioides sp. YIM 152588 TaxID=3158259 RepID=UPI0032E3EBD3
MRSKSRGGRGRSIGRSSRQTTGQTTGQAIEGPELLKPVTLVVRRGDGSVEELASQVQDLEQGADGWIATLARPERADGLPVARPGDADWIDLRWVTPTGLARVPVEAAGASRPYGPVWLATPLGAVDREQRRAHFRVALAADLTVTRVVAEGTDEADAAEEPRPERGWVVDLGEGGVLAGLEGDLPAVGELVDVAIALDAGEVRRRARVVRPVSFPGGTSGVALEFTGPHTGDRALREALLDAQRRQARSRLG